MHWYPATLAEASALTESGRRLVFDVPDWPGSIPGQHVDVRLTAPDGYQASRSYSLASQGPGERIELAVDRLPDGEVSPYLVDVAELGDQVEVRGPLGGWFIWRPGNPRPVQMIAGGSGVVPFLSMVRAHERAGDGAPFRLLYSVRSDETAMYRDELRAAAGTAVDWIHTRQAPLGTARPAGRVTDAELDALVIPVEQDPLVFVCGSTTFVEHVSQVLVRRGHAESALRLERFGG